MVTIVIACYIFLLYCLITRKTFYFKNFNILLVAIAVITAAKGPLDLVFLFWSIAVKICCGAYGAEIAIVLSVLLTILVIVLDRLPIGRAPMILVMNFSAGKLERKVMKKVGEFCRRSGILMI